VKLPCRIASTLFIALALAASAGVAAAQITDVLGSHDLSPGSPSPVQGPLHTPCTYCHVPHSGNGNLAPLWNQKLSDQTYTTYTSTTAKNTDNPKPPLGSHSELCLSCHDGTVAAGDSVLFGKMPMSGSLYSADQFGANLQNSHPFSIVKPIKDSISLVQSLAVSGTTSDPTVKLINGNVECASCHNAHIQSVDRIAPFFLVRDSSNGSLCLACHDPNRTATNQVNPLAGWIISAHATASQNKLASQANAGPYPTVAANACASCHAEHNAAGPARLLRGLNEQACIACHNGGSNVSPAAPNVFAEFGKKGHPFPAGTNLHDAAEPTLLNNNRHATCADCHESHAAQRVATFNPPPLMRISQAGVAGISALDGISVLTPAANNYENCLRCHGSSAGKQANPLYGYLPVRAAADPLNVLTQFNTSAKSTHPVMRARSGSTATDPSVFLTMLDLQGSTTSGRAMGSQIFCTDCHNSDDNREFGGTGANGPHGSKNWHILEHDYESSQAPAGPGTAITVNLNPKPDLSVNGPYGMCAKCHDLNVVVTTASWTAHLAHVSNDGFSCSTCHSAHGVGATAENPTGERMIDFDVNVVGQNNGQQISYNRATNTCTLTCHNAAHNPDGSITGAGAANSAPKIPRIPIHK
jgi:predicted CXXCH cytochrome family protein